MKNKDKLEMPWMDIEAWFWHEARNIRMWYDIPIPKDKNLTWEEKVKIMREQINKEYE